MLDNRFDIQSEQIVQLFGALFQNKSLGILVINKEGEIILANNFLLSLFEYSEPSDIIGKKIEILIPERFHKHHVSDRTKYTKKPEQRPMGIGRDLFGRKKSGSEFPVEISLSGYKNGDDVFVIAFVSDISRRKEIEESVFQQQQQLAETNRTIETLNQELETKVNLRTEELQATMKRLEAALEKEKDLNELKSRFVSMASHEFRTPLSTVLSSAYLIKQYQLTEDQVKRDKHLERIISSVSMLTDILNDFLSVGKIEEGKIQVRLTEFNIEEHIKAIAEEIKNILQKGQVIQYRHEGDPIVLLDPSLLKHIVMNLVSNAVKFSPEDTIIEIKTICNEHCIILSVKDHGIGISNEDQKHLMERFFRATNAGNIQGTGLGLHIISKYAELMNGAVECKSELEKGTEFIINFNKTD